MNVGEDINSQPDTAEHLLLFIFSTWDLHRPLIKRAVARYAVGAKLLDAELLQKIEHVICALHVSGFLVNQVSSDGASKNVLALRLLATHTAKEVFKYLNPKLPQDVLVTFKHSSGYDRWVFIGGEMPHWVKRVVNGLENSSKVITKL